MPDAEKVPSTATLLALRDMLHEDELPSFIEYYNSLDPDNDYDLDLG